MEAANFYSSRSLGPLISVVLVLLLVSSTSAGADCLDRVASFASTICGEIEKAGTHKVVDASGNVELGVKGIIARVVGNATADVTGKRLTDVYEGVVREDLGPELFNVRDCRIKMVELARAEACPKPAIAKSCRHPDFGVQSWRYSEEFSGNSGWRGGGRSQSDWCRELIGNVLRERRIGSDHVARTLSSSEQNRMTWDRHAEYNYSCKVRIKWGPTYNEGTGVQCKDDGSVRNFVCEA